MPPSGKELIQSKLLFESLESKYGLSKGLLDRQWFAESGRGKICSPAGATGHFQFMPATANRFKLSREDTFDLSKSALAATKYMSLLKIVIRAAKDLQQWHITGVKVMLIHLLNMVMG